MTYFWGAVAYLSLTMFVGYLLEWHPIGILCGLSLYATIAAIDKIVNH